MDFSNLGLEIGSRSYGRFVSIGALERIVLPSIDLDDMTSLDG